MQSYKNAQIWAKFLLKLICLTKGMELLPQPFFISIDLIFRF